ncbi:MAG: hypothetical protein KAW39_03175 [Thermoplasmata archaeon]|nr:hypothetical protein [Thermoplasmata archaeon]
MSLFTRKDGRGINYVKLFWFTVIVGGTGYLLLVGLVSNRLDMLGSVSFWAWAFFAFVVMGMVTASLAVLFLWFLNEVVGSPPDDRSD